MTCIPMLAACGLPNNIGHQVLIFGFCVLVLFLLLIVLFLHITNLIRITLVLANPQNKRRHLIWFIIATVCGVFTRFDVFPLSLKVLFGLIALPLVIAQSIVLRDQRRQTAAPKSPPSPPPAK